MEIVFIIGIVVAIAVLASKRKKSDQSSMPYDPAKANTPSETPEERKQRETDELITTVLPTINNGK